MNIRGVDRSAECTREFALKSWSEESVVILSIGNKALVITADQKVVIEDVTRRKLTAKESRLLNAVRIIGVCDEVDTFLGSDDRRRRRQHG